MRYVDLEAVQIAETLRLRPAGGEVLVEGEVPLIWAFTGHGIRAVVLGFTFAQTDLALHPAFPILLSNALEWLAGPGPAMEAGQTMMVPAGREREARLTDPGGGVRTIPARNGRFPLPSFDRAGIYTLSVGAQRRQIAVNVPAVETAIAPSVAPASPASGSAQSGPDRMIAIWPLLIGGALALLVFEWFLWLRTLPKVRSPRGKSPLHRTARALGN